MKQYTCFSIAGMILAGVHLEAFASGDGSISGKAFDSETRKPLFVVNAIPKGTKLITPSERIRAIPLRDVVAVL